jgi:4'-phosphopantetheinyl transferase
VTQDDATKNIHSLVKKSGRSHRKMNQSLPLLNLSADEVHLWLAFPEQITDSFLLQKYDQLMNEEETNQQHLFHFEHHRHDYLVTRALVRSVLSRYALVSPEQWQFSKNDYGKPEILHSKNIPKIRFNLSHTKGLIACAVTLEKDIGVDVESITRKEGNLKLADRFFSHQESQALRLVQPDQQKERFFDYWTLKEAFIKACGKGLSIPLDQFSFYLSDSPSLRISFEKEFKSNPKCWKFYQLKPTEQHTVAIAIHDKTTAITTTQVSIKSTIPLLTENSFFCDFIRQS